MKLFSVGKIGVTLDHIVHKLEKRKDGEVKVIELKCRVAPLTPLIASAVDEIVKAALFKRTSGEPHAYVKEFLFLLPIDRQQVYIFASPDTVKPSILFDQVKVSNLRARTEKGAIGYALTFSLTFSQDDSQLSYSEAWRTQMRFISVEESEPSLDFADADEVEDDDDETPSRPAPMFDDPRDAPQPQSVGAAAAKKKDRAQHKPISHAKKRGKKR